MRKNLYKSMKTKDDEKDIQQRGRF